MLKPNYPALQERISDEDLYISITAAGGSAGLRQLDILSFTKNPDPATDDVSWCYSNDIYGTLSELLEFAEEDLKAGKGSRIHPGRCHRGIERNMIGENSLETWLLFGGTLLAYSREGKINVEARVFSNLQFSDEYFSSSSETLGESLQQLDDIMSAYDLPKLEGELEYEKPPTETEIQKQLVRIKKRSTQTRKI